MATPSFSTAKMEQGRQSRVQAFQDHIFNCNAQHSLLPYSYGNNGHHPWCGRSLGTPILAFYEPGILTKHIFHEVHAMISRRTAWKSRSISRGVIHPHSTSPSEHRAVRWVLTNDQTEVLAKISQDSTSFLALHWSILMSLLLDFCTSFL